MLTSLTPGRSGSAHARAGSRRAGTLSPTEPGRRETTMTRIPYKWIVASVFVCAAFMDIMDTTIVNVALPTLAREFNASTASIEWVVIGYLLSLAVWIPASGYIGDRIGTKKVFLFALGTFTLASALCGQATSLGELVAFRVLQGVGGGMLVPVGTAMLFRAFPPIERARASTILIIPTVLAPALGPIIGGWLVTDVSWRWIFYVNLPVGMFGFVVGVLLPQGAPRADGGQASTSPGSCCRDPALALVLVRVLGGTREGLDVAASSSPPASADSRCSALLASWRRTSRDPMLALRLYRERMFRNANLVLALTYGSFAGVLFLLPIFLQELRGLSALQSGLTTFPQAIGVMISSQLVGRLYHRVGPRRLIVVRHVRDGARHHVAGVRRPDDQPVVDPAHHVRPRHLHGVLVRAAPGRDLRQHHPRGHRPGDGHLLDPAPGRGGARGRRADHRAHRAGQLLDASWSAARRAPTPRTCSAASTSRSSPARSIVLGAALRRAARSATPTPRRRCGRAVPTPVEGEAPAVALVD